MTQIGEAIKAAGMNAALGKCPFDEPEPPKDPEPDDEDYAWDDKVSMSAAQANSASKLGTNLRNGSPGKVGTWNVLGGDPPREQAAQEDTERFAGRPKVLVAGRNYPYTVAAHHLIPGNGSLYESTLFKSYMVRDGKMEVDEPKAMTFTVSRNIGYNVNGSHNGAWLPGNYAIRDGVHPSKRTWSLLVDDPAHVDWCYEYIAAVTKKTGFQYHDTHVEYYTNVLEVLNKFATKFIKHQQICDDCQEKKKVPPPYVLKNKLYRLSGFLRGKMRRGPRYWASKFPWMASDQVRTDIFGNSKVKAAFVKIYNKL